MISTFDLTLLGSLVCFGGLLFLLHRSWPHFGRIWLSGSQPDARESTMGSCERLEQSTVLAGTRWLTVGTLTLFFAYAQGGEGPYLFGPWSDVLFHLVFVSGCWGVTAVGIKRKAGVPAGRLNDNPVTILSLPGTHPARIND